MGSKVIGGLLASGMHACKLIDLAQSLRQNVSSFANLLKNLAN